MKGLIYMNIKTTRENGGGVSNPTQEQLRESLLHSVSEELMANQEMFLHFANIAINDVPWKKVKEEYVNLLPTSLFMLEGMWFQDHDSIITKIQEILQDLGCEKIASHSMYDAYGIKEVMFGRLFSPKEDVDEENPKISGFEEHLVPAAKKLYRIARLFEVVDTWPNTKHCDERRKLEIVTKMVNLLTTF